MLQRVKTAAFGIILAALAFFSAAGGAETKAFEIRRIGNIHPYADNAFLIKAEEGGSLSIRIHDNICVYRTIRQDIQAGETTIQWDGCGYNEEKLYEKSYTITVDLTTLGGEIHTVSFQSPIDYPVQKLQYALSSSGDAYLDQAGEWFLEFRTVMKGTVRIDFTRDGTDEAAYSYTIPAEGGKILRKNLKEIAGTNLPEAGEYVVRVYEASVPDDVYRLPLTVHEGLSEKTEAAVTGTIMPDRTMSSEEIWEIMMKPSVVIDIDFFKHQEVRAEPDEKSASLGTLHGQTQALEVMEIENNWARIGAWNHENASYIEGWVPLEKLKVEYPRTEYGILIDKQKQTLTVYREGREIDTLLVSTGRMDEKRLYQETSAGSFLTGYHRVNFSMNGKKYDYVIQYDGGNLLHQTPYHWGQQKKDFTLGRGYLGAKASHACIRIQPEPGEGGLNAYWLFTHIPYHTRVIILDDEEERTAYTDLLTRNEKTGYDMALIRRNSPQANGEAGSITVTFGGRLIPGGTKAFNTRRDSLAAFTEKEGYGKPLSKMTGIFSEDDLTCVSLGGYFTGSSEEPEVRKALFAAENMEQILKDSSIEAIGMSDPMFRSSAGPAVATAGAAGSFAETFGYNKTATVTIKGHMFGLAGLNEDEYLKDPAAVEKALIPLKENGCEKVICLIHWGESGENRHSIVQEAMAHRCVRAGADLVIGNNGGTIQGIDYIEGVPVVYSLGNLLDGSQSGQSKNRYGLLARVEFNMESDENGTGLTLVPMIPYGTTREGKNDYMPSADITEDDAESAIRLVWQDSTDRAMWKTLFRFPGQE